MKKQLFKVMAIAAVSLTLAGCKAKVESVSIDETSIVLPIDGTKQLTATVKPDNAKNKEVKWSTNVDNIEVSSTGLVTAKAAGEAVVTVTTVEGGKTAQCNVTVKNEYLNPKEVFEVDAPVSPNDSYVQYLANINPEEGADTRNVFFDLNQGYAVGDDNRVNVKPSFAIYKIEDDEEYDQNFWSYDFEIKVERQILDRREARYEEASADEYSIVDAKNADIKFSENAIGKTYRVTVNPGELTEEQKANPNYYASYIFDVVDGYNVYTAKELSVLDVRHGNEKKADGSALDWHPGDVSGFADEWDALKEANGIDVNAAPTSIILHKNLKVTQEDVPANVLYNAAEAKAAGLPEIEGTWKDTAHPITLSTDRDILINGNYFTVDFSELALNNRGQGSSDSIVNSHTSFLRVVNGSLEMKNINFTGNAPKADGNEGNKYAGGLMLVKADRDAKKINIHNTLARSHFITGMSGEAYPSVEFTVDKCKFYDNYNSFFYNWGGEVTVRDSILRSCGGPIVIQDHTGLDAAATHEERITVGSLDFFKVYGITSTTKFVDCELYNYLLGEEAWFNQYGGTALVGGIRKISDCLYKGSSAVKQAVPEFPLMSYICDENFAPTYSENPNQKLFNLIALNKSGTAEGATNIPVSGNVTIEYSGKSEVFNYSRPNEELAADMETLVYGSDEQKMAIFAKYGATSEEDLAQKMGQKAVEVNYEHDMYVHGGLRAMNANGAPVIQLGSGFGWTDTVDFFDVYAKAHDGTNTQVDYSYFANGLTNNYTGLYYNGMEIVFGLIRG